MIEMYRKFNWKALKARKKCNYIVPRTHVR